jgi:hypothetical protein
LEAKQEGPNWPAFFRLLARGRLRRLGLAPMPPELKKKMDRVDRAAQQQKAVSR